MATSYHAWRLGLLLPEARGWQRLSIVESPRAHLTGGPTLAPV
jgi:hypothetical protein